MVGLAGGGIAAERRRAEPDPARRERLAGIEASAGRSKHAVGGAGLQLMRRDGQSRSSSSAVLASDDENGKEDVGSEVR